MSITINCFDKDVSTSELKSQLCDLLTFDDEVSKQVDTDVDAIIQRVKAEGDTALIGLTNQFDQRQINSIDELVIDAQQLERAKQSLPTDVLNALEQAAERIRLFHQQQIELPWMIEDADGNQLGQKITAIEKVGIYVPGGTASYPSSVLMNAIPAMVAGVEDITMVSPAPKGEVSQAVLAAAAMANVSRVYTLGGAQAIAALAYGTKTIDAVDKIVGPGNLYVATAKRKLFGKVGIDMVAGPSELLIYADQGIDAMWLAKDLCSQAEHDPQAQVILLTQYDLVIQAVIKALNDLVPQLPRADIVIQALRNRGALIKVKDDTQALAMINHIAPEHLALSVANAEQLVGEVNHAGAIFVGYHSTEAQGDYCAGPSHVLPTSATSRFSSPLGVQDFIKRSSIIHSSKQGAKELGQLSAILARQEGLEAHALSAEARA